MHVICMYPSTSLAARRTELIAASEAVEEAEGKAEKPPCWHQWWARFFPNFACYSKVFRCKKRLIYKYIYTILDSEYMYIRTHTIIRIYHTIRRICTYSHIHSYFEAGVLHFFRLWEHAPIIQAKLWYQAARLVTMMPFVGSFTIRWFRITMRVWKEAQIISTKFRQILESVFWSLMLVPVWWVCEPSSPVLTVPLLRSESGAH